MEVDYVQFMISFVFLILLCTNKLTAGCVTNLTVLAVDCPPLSLYHRQSR